MNNAMLICPRCRNAEYVSAKFVGKKFFCHKCGNLAVVVDSENLKKFDLKKLNIKVENEVKNQKYIINEEENPSGSEVKEVLGIKYKESILSESSNTNEQESAPKVVENKPEVVENTFDYSNVFIYRFIDTIYKSLQKITTSQGAEDLNSFCVRVCQFLLHFLSLFIIIAGLVFSIRSRDYEQLMYALGISIFIFLSQYFSINCLELLHKLKTKIFKNYTSDLTFKTFFAVALVLLSSMLCFVLTRATNFTPVDFGFFTIETEYSLLMAGLLMCFVLWSLIACYLHPDELLFLKKVDNQRAASEFLSTITIFLTSILRATPVLCFSCIFYVGTLFIYDCGSDLVNQKTLKYNFFENKEFLLICFFIYFPLLVYYTSFIFFFLIDLISLFIAKYEDGHPKNIRKVN